MKILYIQDQEIGIYKGAHYHSKSEHFFERYLAGLGENDSLVVYCGFVNIKDENVVNRYQRIDHPQIQFKQLPEFRKLSNLLAIYKIVRKAVKEADFCYLRSGIASAIASLYCKKYNIPYMAIVNEDVFKNLWMHPNKVFKLFAYPLSWFTHRMVKDASYACYVTKDYLQKQYPCNGETCGCSDIEFLEIDNRAVEDRIKKIDELEDKIVIGTVGSVSAKLKGQDTVIKTLSYLRNMGFSNYKYQLVGSGSPLPLQKLAKELGVDDIVEFLGPFSHEDVLKWFKNIDIYVHPSHSEGLPRTILEAMTKATPCICTSVGGVPELIEDKFLFSYNGNELAELSSLLHKMNKETMKRTAVNNFEHSKAYDPYVLENRRRVFFTKAILEIKKNK